MAGRTGVTTRTDKRRPTNTCYVPVPQNSPLFSKLRMDMELSPLPPFYSSRQEGSIARMSCEIVVSRD